MYKQLKRNDVSVGEKPAFSRTVIGFYEITKKELIVEYDNDCNRFFYKGEVIPYVLMNKWRLK